MQIVNSIYSFQGLDQQIAITMQLLDHSLASHVLSVVHFAPSMSDARSPYSLDLVARKSDIVVAVGSSPNHLALADLCRTHGTPFHSFRRGGAFDRLRVGSLLRRLIHNRTHALRSHADVNPLTELIVDLVRGRQGTVHAFLEGSYPPGDTLPKSYFKSARVSLADNFLLYSRSHEDFIHSLGYQRTATIGYPKLFPAWRKAAQLSVQRLRRSEENRPVICFFTRGQEGRPDKSILDNRSLHAILESALSVIQIHYRDPVVLLKPHPLQDRSVIEDVCRQYDFVEETQLHVAQLAALASLVVTTWSSSILEALAIGTPAIEYFIPSAYFQEIYPNGSSYKEMGIPSAETHEDFMSMVSAITKGRLCTPSLQELFKHGMDLSVFET